VLDLTAPMAAAVAFGTLVLAWLFYERCAARRSGATRSRWRWWAMCFWWGHLCLHPCVQRARRFTQIGALVGTIMVANRLHHRHPEPKEDRRRDAGGQGAQSGLGRGAKQRSVHNNYLTLPVVFLMIANHYPLMFATRFNWLIVAIVLAIGPVIRHFFNSRHEGKGSPWWTWGVAGRRHAGGGVALRRGAKRCRRACRQGRTPSGAERHHVPLQHVPHERAVWPGVHGPPKDVVLDSPETSAGMRI